MEVVVGTYEELLLGYKLQRDSEKYEFVQSFTDHSHIGCVKALAVSVRGVVASGSSDERIHLFNMISRKELGSLMHHTGTVTSLDFFGSHMFSTSEDGTIVVWKTGKWEAQRTLRGHKGPVYGLAVHPTGKMALSVGKDKTLRTWNLITAKCAFITNLKQVGELTLWSSSGNRYIIIVNNTVDIYTIETGSVQLQIKSSSRISIAKFLEDDTLVVGGDEGVVHLYDINTGTHLHEINTKTNRVKAMEYCRSEDDGFHLVTASSDGNLKMWHLKQSQDKWKSTLLASHNCKFRPTCMTLVPERTSKVEIKEEAPEESADKTAEESADEAAEELSDEAGKESAEETSDKQEQSDDEAQSEEEKPPTKPVRVKKPMKRIGSDTGHSTAGKRKALAKSAGQQKTTKQAMKKQQKQKKAKLHTQNI